MSPCHGIPKRKRRRISGSPLFSHALKRLSTILMRFFLFGR